MKRDAIDFAKDPVGELFRKMLLPTLLGMISIVALNVTDGAFVGHGAGSDSIAAVNIVSPVYMIISGIGLMFGIGGSVVASIHLSKGKNKAANINITQAVAGGFIICTISAIILLCFQEETVRFFGATETLVPLACSYLKWVAPCQPLCTLSVMGMFFIRLDGSPKVASTITVISALMNIFLDWLFVFPLQMGIEGAAIATTFSYMSSGVAAFIYIGWFGKKIHFYHLKMSLKSIRLTLRNLWYQAKIGFSAFIGEISISTLMIVGNQQFANALGENGVAAFSVACYLLPFIFMFANAIVESVQPIISFAHGIGNRKRLGEVLRISFVSGIISAFAIILILALFPSQVSTIFLNKGCEAWEICRNGIPFFGITTIFTMINVIFVGYCQSIEKGREATLVTLLRGFVFLVPAFLLLPKLLGIKGLWIAMAVAEALTMFFVLMKILFYYLRKLKK